MPHAYFDGTLTLWEKKRPDATWVYVYGPTGGINSNVLDIARWIGSNPMSAILPTGQMPTCRLTLAEYTAYTKLLAVLRGWSADMFACAMKPKGVYDQVGGISEKFSIE